MFFLINHELRNFFVFERKNFLRLNFKLKSHPRFRAKALIFLRVILNQEILCFFLQFYVRSVFAR